MDSPRIIEFCNSHCAIRLDRQTGGLVGLACPDLDDDVLKAGAGGPFRIHAGFGGQWLLDTDPEVAASAHVSPGDMCVTEVRRSTSGVRQHLKVVSHGRGLACDLRISLAQASGESVWELAVTNTGDKPHEVLVDFPVLEGVNPGPRDAPLRATRMDMTGQIVPAWDYPGGIYGNGGEWSMQWHAVYDPETGSALGLIVEDPGAAAKRLVLARPKVMVRHFPPRTLAPGASMTLPPVRLVVGPGGWKPTARAYARWYARNVPSVRPPRWVRDTDVLYSGHFHKCAPGERAGERGQYVLESFRQWPEAHLQTPYGCTEYAFWTRGSQLYGVHTDGDNYVREDLGGAECMRDGIAELHRLGLRTTLYLEGYIVPESSELARDGKAQRWQVVHHDGSTEGNYTQERFYHMCAGCAEWQDHLASVVSRLLRETGADGIRLDSLGFYFLPCYNPEHKHRSPFDYNAWMAQLLAKVRSAAVNANPMAYLTTEAPVDYYGRWFHGALTDPSRGTLDGGTVYVREVPPMRLAVAPYRTVLWCPGGPVWASVMGIAGGSGSLNWICAQEPVHEALTAGDVADDDPVPSDPAIATRMFHGPRCDVVVAAQYKAPGRWWEIGGVRAPYEVSLPMAGSAAPVVAVCDVETLTWSTAHPSVRDGRLTVALEARWALVVIPRDGERVVQFETLPDASPGGEVTIHPETLVGAPNAAAIEVVAPGLSVGPWGAPRFRAHTGDAIRIGVPADAVPGWYSVRVRGARVLGVRRLLRVVPRS